MSRMYPPAVRVSFYVIKFVGICFGLVSSLVCAMSLVGAVVENGWLRLLLGTLLVLIPPLFVADRLLPEDGTPAPGLVSDVLSLTWVGFPVLWALALSGISRPLLAREGDRLAAADHEQLAGLAYLLASVEPKAPTPSPAPVPAASGSAVAPAVSASASTSPLAVSAPASASAPAAPDARPLQNVPATGEKTPAQLFKELAPSVVTIFLTGNHPGEEVSGTGFLIDSKGTIATNHHVIEHGKTIQIRFHNGASFNTADLLVDSPAVDLALLAIDIEHPADAGPKVEAKPLILGDSDKVVVGERALSIGNPLGLEHTLTDGLVSARRIYEGKAWIQMSVPVSPGNSGGPLFNMRGEVIGITTRQVLGGMFGRAQNLNLAIPVNELKKLIAPSYPSRRQFGERGTNGGQWLLMREPIVASLTFLGLVALGITLAIRPRVPHTPAFTTPLSAPSSIPSAMLSGGSRQSPSSLPVPSAPVPAGSEGAPGSSSSGVPAPEAPKMDRVLQVAVLGWELAVPMVVANQGLDPSPQGAFAKAGVGVKLSVTDRLSAIENALARGGADRDGADIAVLPLPSFVAAYERLRALNLEIFFVVGWSRGRDALMASRDWLTSVSSGELELAGDENTASLFLGLFALDLAGYTPSKLKIVPSSKAAEAQLAAQDRASPFEGAHRQTLLSTADASRLIPYVAVAQRSLVERHTMALAAWCRGWLAGQAQVESDPAVAARQVGSTQGAPGPLPLLKGLGEMQPSSLADGIRTMGLSGRNAATLEVLFQEGWRLWKAHGLLMTPAPDTAPVSTVVMTALARAEATPPLGWVPPKVGSDKGKPLLVVRVEGELEDRTLETKLGLLASVFERSVLRVSLKKDGAKLKKFLENIQGAYDVAPGRLIPGARPPDRGNAQIEVFPAP
ncbi:MAG: trypsin-like peptidase domain-containing protein [Myxococcales bacterium]|nr:trypsin-like peptidase domain-containing protein [Polyangiaceae bacterium]MDW8249700.1 trypsin-like peptidase domain-containing protein [Myxococcales bacterium]